MWLHVKLDKVCSCVQISSMQQKCHQCYDVHLLIFKYLSCDRQIMLAINVTKFSFRVFSTFESIFLKYLKYLQSWFKFKIIISNNMWANIFRSEFGSFIFVFLVMYLAYILFLLLCHNIPPTLRTERCYNLL